MNENDRLNTNQQDYGQPSQPGFNAGYGKPPGVIPQQTGYPQQVGYPQYPRQAGYPQQGAGYPPPPPPPQQLGTVYIDPENPGRDEEAIGFGGFSDKSIRRRFIRKVYAILSVQLGVTVVGTSLFLFHEPTKTWVQNNPLIWLIAFILLIVTLFPLICCESIRRKSPINFIFLGLFTLTQPFFLGAISATYGVKQVPLAVAITATVCFCLTIFAFQTRWDFTVIGGFLFVAVILLILFSTFAIIFKHHTLHIVYSGVGGLLFCVYLVYDTQLMIGGNHIYSIGPEEYIFAVLNLYLDIINIFIYVLRTLGSSKD